MAEKFTTLGQLRKLALRGKSNAASQIDILTELVIKGLEDAQHLGISLALPAANWLNETQTVKHPSLLADSNYWYLILGDSGVKADNITVDGEVTFRCETAPEADLTIQILRLEVEI